MTWKTLSVESSPFWFTVLNYYNKIPEIFTEILTQSIYAYHTWLFFVIPEFQVPVNYSITSLDVVILNFKKTVYRFATKTKIYQELHTCLILDNSS